jgi:ankyrin repeat protein
MHMPRRYPFDVTRLQTRVLIVVLALGQIDGGRQLSAQDATQPGNVAARRLVRFEIAGRTPVLRGDPLPLRLLAHRQGDAAAELQYRLTHVGTTLGGRPLLNVHRTVSVQPDDLEGADPAVVDISRPDYGGERWQAGHRTADAVLDALEPGAVYPYPGKVRETRFSFSGVGNLSREITSTRAPGFVGFDHDNVRVEAPPGRHRLVSKWKIEAMDPAAPDVVLDSWDQTLESIVEVRGETDDIVEATPEHADKAASAIRLRQVQYRPGRVLVVIWDYYPPPLDLAFDVTLEVGNPPTFLTSWVVERKKTAGGLGMSQPSGSVKCEMPLRGYALPETVRLRMDPSRRLARATFDVDRIFGSTIAWDLSLTPGQQFFHGTWGHGEPGTVLGPPPCDDGLGTPKCVGKTPLHLAAQRGVVDEVRQELGRGAPVDVRDGKDLSPLHVASRFGHPAVVRLLMEAGAEPRSTTRKDWTALHFGARHAHPEVVRQLIDHIDVNAVTQGGATPLYLACQVGCTECVTLLLARGADLHIAVDSEATPLYVAASKGHLPIVELLLEHGAQVDARKRGDWTPLHAAALGGHADVMKHLLARGAEIDAQAAEGATPLHQAVRSGRLDVVQVLLDYAANSSLRDDSGRTPLELARSAEEAEIVKLLQD